MNDTDSPLLGRLIDRAFAEMSPAERRAFIEKLFLEQPPETQERLLLDLIREQQQKEGARSRSLHRRWTEPELQPAPIGPWMTCCQMMVRIDRAEAMETLDAGAPAQIFSALADETRLRLVKLLTAGEQPVEALTSALDTAQSTVSHHLRILREAGLVQGRRQGRNVFYSLTHPLVEG